MANIVFLVPSILFIAIRVGFPFSDLIYLFIYFLISDCILVILVTSKECLRILYPSHYYVYTSNLPYIHNSYYSVKAKVNNHIAKLFSNKALNSFSEKSRFREKSFLIISIQSLP